MAQRQALSCIIERLAIDASSEEAWVDLFRQLYPFVIAALYRKMKGFAILSIEDCAQEVFIRLLKAKPFKEIRDPNAFRGYVWRTAENVANTQLTSYLAIERYKVDFRDETQTIEDTKDNSDSRHIAFEQLLQTGHSMLTPEERTLLQLLLEGNTLGEISERIGINYANVGVRTHRLKLKLGKLLKGNDKK